MDQICWEKKKCLEKTVYSFLTRVGLKNTAFCGVPPCKNLQ